MPNPTLFGMVSTKASRDYTTPALHSFIRNTNMGAQDRLVLIDNDASLQAWNVPCERIVPIAPRGFGANVNALLDMADEYDQDLCFLSNDVYFTPGWWDALATQDDSAILLPECNQVRQYRTASGLDIAPVMQLRDTANREHEVDEAARFHAERFGGTYSLNRIMPFYVFRLPRKVYRSVGYFETSLGPAGGEDVDYRLRAMQLGISTAFVGGSYLLHYHGKSTWDGAESRDETRARDSEIFNRFRDKWGQDVADLCITGGDPERVLADQTLLEAAKRGEWQWVIRKVLDGRGEL